MTFDRATLRLALIGLIIGGLAASWWIAFDRGRHWRAEAETVAAQRDRLQAEVERLGGGRVPAGLATSSAGRPDVVRIRAIGCESERTGTGVVIDGEVLTNRHVVAGARAVMVTSSDGTDRKVDSARAAADLDIAVLKVGGLLRGDRLESLGDPADGEAVTIGGFAFGGRRIERTVRVAAHEAGTTEADPPRLFRLDGAVEPGESGSPVFDRNGRVAGLVYARAHGSGAALVIGGRDVARGRAAAQPVAFAGCP